MAEQMSEEQVLDVFAKYSGDSSPEQQQTEGTAAPQEEVKQEVKQEEVKQEAQPVDSTEEEAETIEIDPDEPLFEQEIHEGGKKSTQKLSLKELQQGYLRQRDYTQKTQELAKQRDELPRAYAKQMQDLSESYANRLSELQQLAMKTVAAELEGVDWERLAIDNPLDYPAKLERRMKLERLLQTIQAENRATTERQTAEKNKTKAERWQKSLEILHRDIPDFGPDVAKRLIDAGKDWGFEPQEIAEWDDPRQIKMLHALIEKAADKKAVESKRPEVEKKVALVTKTLKPGAKTAQRTQMDEAKARLKKSGKLEDALPIFEQFVR